MIPLRLVDIVANLNCAKLVGNDCLIREVTIDSRLIKKDSLFIALKGDKFDAHNFVGQAVNLGVKAILVNRYLSSFKVSQIIVLNTYCALRELSFLVRNRISAYVIAVTGSSGKTSVKEMTYSILRNCGKVLSTYKNSNNCLGVSLTLLRLTFQDDFAVIELGASECNDVLISGNLIAPKIALVNNLFASHLSGFKSLNNLSVSKGKIFSSLLDFGHGIINDDNNNWNIWKYMLRKQSVWKFSLFSNKNSHFFATDIINTPKGISFFLHTPIGGSMVYLSVFGIHNVSNSLAASSISISVGANLSDVVNGLEGFKPIPGRLFPIHISHKCLLLDDTYNSNYGSMNVAIDVLKSMSGYRILVVGDMDELGVYSFFYHKKLGKKINLSGIDKVLSVGSFSFLFSCFSGCGEHFKNKQSLIIRLKQLLYHRFLSITVLIKGSRSSKMEDVIYALL